MSETPREFYLRAVVREGAIEIIMGLEFEPDFNYLDVLRDDMKKLARTEMAFLHCERSDDDAVDAPLAQAISAAMGKRWPGRRYFLEVQHDDPDEGWVQVITPSGWPPKGAS